MGCPTGHPGCYLAAAAAIVVATATIIVAAVTVTTVTAAAAEQQDQDDDPPATIPTKTVVTHIKYLHEFSWRLCRSFQDIPQQQKGAANKSYPPKGLAR